SAVEMAAVADATALAPQARGLGFPPCGSGELAARLRPADGGGGLDRRGTLEGGSRPHADGAPAPAGWPRACTPTARPCRETCAGACSSRSPPPTASWPRRSPPTASRPPAM